MRPKLINIKDMPNFNPSVKNGLTSVSEGKIFWTEGNKVTCREHGACLALNSDRNIWRCTVCNEGAFVVWVPTREEIYRRLTHSQIQQLIRETFGENHAKYHTLDEIQLDKLIKKTEAKP